MTLMRLCAFPVAKAFGKAVCVVARSSLKWAHVAVRPPRYA